jgi:probable HAF family extracellular repeat protein
MIDIHPQLPNNEANESYAYGINDSGQVAGYYYANDGYSHPFLYANGVWKDLGTLDGRDTMAYAINDHGQIVGQGYSAKGRIYYDWQACLYSGGQWVELPPFDVPSKAYAINDPGQIAGMIGSSAGIYFPPRLPDIFNLLLD